MNLQSIKMAKTRKPINSNSVYSEILIRLGSKKDYVNSFMNEFEEKDAKSQPVLRKQLLILKEEGYVNEEDLKDGKHFEMNKKIFCVNWEKIVGEFLMHSEKELTHLKEINENKGIIKFINDFHDKFLNKKQDLSKNYWLQKFFSLWFDNLKKSNRFMTLEEFFHEVIRNDLLLSYPKKLREMQTEKDKLGFYQLFPELMLNDKHKEFKELERFAKWISDAASSKQFYQGKSDIFGSRN